MLKDFLSLFFPEVCAICSQSLVKGEKSICINCINKLPKINYCNKNENAIEQVFWGRVNLHFAFAYCFFEKGNSVQKILHQIKYKNRKDLAELMGNMLAKEMIFVTQENNIDLIVPVPLHPIKHKKRGYNQSEFIAKGIAESIDREYNSSILKRNIYTESQTKKSRYNRWRNAEYAFHVTHPEKLENKHVLLVDDVITTGATLEACAQKILEIPGAKVSVASIAFTKL